MTNSDNKNDGILPNHVLHEIGEHTPGGFAIFYFNPETGLPEHLMFFQSASNALAMQKYMSDWLQALHEVQIAQAIDAIQGKMEIPPEDEDEEEDENTGTSH